MFWTCPEQNSFAVVERCGAFSHMASKPFAVHRDATSSFHASASTVKSRACRPSHHKRLTRSVAGTISLRVRQLDVQCETKTMDNVFVTVVVSVQYQVEKASAYDAFYKLTDSKQQISSYVFDVVRSTVPKMNLDDVFIEKEMIARDIKEELTKSMTGYGFLIIHTLVNDIVPAAKVRDAMNEINAARRMRIAAAEKAEAQKVAVVKAAEAEAEAKYLQGQGIARQRQALINGLKDSVIDFSSEVKGIDAKNVLELMLITQYFDTLRDIGNNQRGNTIFLPHSPAGMADISAQIRNAFMEGAAANVTITQGVAPPSNNMNRG